MTTGDEFFDSLIDESGRRAARPKPKYFYGDRRSDDEAGLPGHHFVDIPEEQFFDPNEANQQ